MSWLYLPEAAADYTEACCSDTLPSALLKSCPTTRKSYCSDSATACSPASPCGMTCAHSTATHGADALTSSAAGFPVRTSAQPERAPESTGNAVDCGAKWQGSFAKYNPATSSWKTAQCSLLEDSDEFSETWPRWGLMHLGACWERTTSAHLTSANEFGFWPTPCVFDTRTDQMTGGATVYMDRTGKPRRKTEKGSASMGLARIVKYATPQASDNRDRGNLSTPAIQRRMEKGKQINLSMSVSTESGRLNPEWVEWLMGWPIGATALSPLAMDKFHEWFQRHGEYSPNEPTPQPPEGIK